MQPLSAFSLPQTAICSNGPNRLIMPTSVGRGHNEPDWKIVKRAAASAVSGPTLGQIIRDLRARKGWTLKEMSEQSGIPVSTLSKVENGRLTLTYDKLQQMSARLKIRMSDPFAEVDPQVESITARRSIGRIDDAVRVTTPNYDYYYLCPELRRKRMIPIVTRIAAKSLNEFGDLVRHSGEEYIH